MDSGADARVFLPRCCPQIIKRDLRKTRKIATEKSFVNCGFLSSLCKTIPE
jgi:hypothetical protein